jgi:tellurite resistance protein
MVVVSASDGSMSEKELRTIGDLTRALPAFRGFESERLVAISRDCSDILAEPDGLDAVLGLIASALPDHLRETAYWLALEVALADSRVKLEEIRVIELLRRALGVDRLVAAALERGARARFQTA